MKTQRIVLAATLTCLLLNNSRAHAVDRETATVESASEVLASLSAIPERAIPPTLLQDAHGVAIIPNLVKAGFVIGGRHGRGVVLVRDAAGGWSNPIFITMTGGSIGWQIGVQSTDVVLVFKNRASLDRIIQGKGKLTLGADAAVAAGPIGRQAEASTDGRLQAEIYSYSRSRGLFAGVSVEGAGVLVDYDGAENFYRVRGGRPTDVLGFRGPVPLPVHRLRMELTKMSTLTMPLPETAPIPLPAPQPVPQTAPPPRVIPLPNPNPPPP